MTEKIEIERKRERIPRCFSRGETLRRGYYYKIIKCGQTLVRTEIRYR